MEGTIDYNYRNILFLKKKRISLAKVNPITKLFPSGIPQKTFINIDL